MAFPFSVSIDGPYFLPRILPGKNRVARSLAAAFCAALVGLVFLAAAADGVADEPAGEGLAGSGIALVPKDAAFVSATLRLREQYDRFVKSNAFAVLKKLPAVARGFEAFEEQQTQPGSPLSIAATFMELPENQQAVELLKDMFSNDTFLYGDPSCVTLVELIVKIQRAQQTANFLILARGQSALDGIDLDLLNEQPVEEEMEDDGAASPVANKHIHQVRLRATDADEQLSPQQITTQLLLKTLAENSDSIVVPDLVWGFKTTQIDAAKSQLKRVEVLGKLLIQAMPELADSLERKKVAGGEVVTFTSAAFDSNLFSSWVELARAEAEGFDAEQVDKVVDAIGSLKIVVALGIIGDRVVLSVGDSIDHLEKLGSEKQSLLATKPFAPLREQSTNPLTAISYVSEPLRKALAASADDIEQLANLADTLAEAADLPEGAAAQARINLKQVASGYRKRLPVLGAWMAFSFLSEQGYEGYAWDWSKNLPSDGSKPLTLLEHAGGSPLGAVVVRTKNDPSQFEDFVAWTDMGWSFFQKYLLPKSDGEFQESFDAIDEHLAPLGVQFVDILRTKILPSLADNQLGFVLDAESKSRRPHRDLPSSAEPLPLIGPAIVLGLADAKLFREGLSDLFSLVAVDLLEKVREVWPGAIPEGYDVPEPTKSKIAEGTAWSFAIPDSGLDEQVQPSIAVGNTAVVFSFLPQQSERLLKKAPFKTGSPFLQVEKPLASAAAFDFVRLFDALEPWVVYVARYGCVQQRDGSVDPDTELNADAENEQATDVLKQTAVVFKVLKSLRTVAASMATKPDATVTHWKSVIRDLPAAK